MQIEKGIPIPKKYATGIAATFRKMEIGDSVVIDANKKLGLYSYAKHVGIKITTKMDGENLRVWRIA